MATIDKKDKSFKIDVTDGTLIPTKSDKSIFNSWRISLISAVIILLILILVDEKFLKILKILGAGIPITFQVTVFGILGSVIIGIITSLGQISRLNVFKTIAGVYVEIIRGIPLLVQIIFIYYALGSIISTDGSFSAILALSICYGAYMGEIFRAGIQSIPKGQMEAAIALGMTRGQAIRKIILPQTMRVIIPAIGNEFIAMLKDSTLVSVIAQRDILRRGREYISRTFQSFETMAIVALVYLILTLILSRVVGIIEEKMNNEE